MTTQTTYRQPVSTGEHSTDTPPRNIASEQRAHGVAPYAWAVTRISLASVFLWAFLDKTFGLGYATPADRAWINGGSTTTGYLSGVEGTFGGLFQGMAGNVLPEWLFMGALLGIGAAMILGIGMRVAAVSAVALLGFMWLASLPLENHPIMDDHLIYAMVAVGLAAQKTGDTLGLGRAWASLPIVQRLPILR